VVVPVVDVGGVCMCMGPFTVLVPVAMFLGRLKNRHSMVVLVVRVIMSVAVLVELEYVRVLVFVFLRDQ
jgi:hypothetical protein